MCSWAWRASKRRATTSHAAAELWARAAAQLDGRPRGSRRARARPRLPRRPGSATTSVRRWRARSRWRRRHRRGWPRRSGLIGLARAGRRSRGGSGVARSAAGVRAGGAALRGAGAAAGAALRRRRRRGRRGRACSTRSRRPDRAERPRGACAPTSSARSETRAGAPRRSRRWRPTSATASASRHPGAGGAQPARRRRDRRRRRRRAGGRGAGARGARTCARSWRRSPGVARAWEEVVVRYGELSSESTGAARVEWTRRVARRRRSARPQRRRAAPRSSWRWPRPTPPAKRWCSAWRDLGAAARAARQSRRGAVDCYRRGGADARAPSPSARAALLRAAAELLHRRMGRHEEAPAALGEALALDGGRRGGARRARRAAVGGRRRRRPHGHAGAQGRRCAGIAPERRTSWLERLGELAAARAAERRGPRALSAS